MYIFIYFNLFYMFIVNILVYMLFPNILSPFVNYITIMFDNLFIYLNVFTQIIRILLKNLLLI